jgi:hypothetical protein
MYEKYYYSIIEYIFDKSKDNTSILFIMNNYYNINEEFKYIIKKKNINVYILTEDNLIYNKLINNITGEDYHNNIYIYNSYDNLKGNILVNNIVIFHIFSIDYLNKILKSINNISYKDTIINIYCSLSNCNNIKIDYKNFIRNKIQSILSYKMGTVINFSDILNNLENNNNINIKSINIFKKSNYIIYGDNTVYKIILSYK